MARKAYLARARQEDLVAGIRAAFSSVFQPGTSLAIVFLTAEQLEPVERVCLPFWRVDSRGRN